MNAPADIKKRHAEAVTKELMDRGLLIEAGWAGFKHYVIAKDAPDVQMREMRLAFFAGAQHVFGSVMTALEPGAEPTDNDLRRFTLIDEELKQFLKEFKLRMDAPQGHG